MMPKTMKSLLVAVFSLSIIFFFNNTFAQEHHTSSSDVKEEKFDPAKEIMGHIRDAYEFHFFTIGHFHATINLPVILYSPQKGWSVFSSSRFGHEGEKTYDGYKLENGNIVPVEPGVKVYDFSLTKNVVQMFIALIVLVLSMTGIARKYKRGQGVTSAPSGWQGAIEPVITFVRDEVAKVNLGNRYERYSRFHTGCR